MASTNLPNRPRLIDISPLAIVKVLAAAALVWLLQKLGAFLGLLFASVLLAVTFDLLVSRMQRHGIPRRLGTGILFLGVVGAMAATVFFLAPALATQIQGFGQSLPKLEQEILSHIPGGWMSRAAERLAAHPEVVLKNWPERLIAFGTLAVSALSNILVALTFAFYFLVDGRRAWEWIVTFFQPSTQKKLRETGREAGNIVAAYVTGQFITSLMVAVFTGVLLWSLGVPGALMLAVFTGLLDVVPVVGITIAISLSALTALSVSPAHALWVAVAYVLYQGLENYVISPKVYGSRMELSNLVVLLALVVGGLLGGAIGVLLSLPVAAAYPAIERIWLKKYLGAEVVERHQEIQGSGGAKAS